MLVNVSIDNSTESELIVTCQFRADITERTQCLVIWHKKEDMELNSAGVNFPTAIFINQSGEYLVAVFGAKDGIIEQHPFLTRSVLIIGRVSMNNYTILSDTTQIYTFLHGSACQMKWRLRTQNFGYVIHFCL